MPKYWGKQIFTHWRFPEVGQKQKTEKKERKRRERLYDGDNNGQATHGARKNAWHTQAAWAKNYSFPSTVSLTAGLMWFMQFKMSINVQVMPQMYIFLTGNFPCCRTSAGSDK